MITWRDYQTEAMNASFAAWETHKHILGVAATGAGKTNIIWGVVERYLEDTPKARVILCAHREELIIHVTQALRLVKAI